MFLFIFESIGTSELLLIGIVALIFLGPRRMPEMARKAAKFIGEFRGTANEFKETWRREVDLEGAAKEFDLNNLEAEAAAAKGPTEPPAPAPAAEVRQVNADELEQLKAKASRPIEPDPAVISAVNDKKNWL